jgi:helicase
MNTQPKRVLLKIEELSVPEAVKAVIIKSGVENLYPPQEEAIRAGVLGGKNFVLASPTASGKTLIAELCTLKHVVEREGKVLYLTPLRALASEKYEEFKKYRVIKKKNGRRIRVGISTGEYDSSDPWLEKYDIIIATNEKADSLLRHRARWMNQLSLLIADEVHLLNDADRGPTLEVVLARLMQVNPEVQLLALSATIRNVEEVAEWLQARFTATDWRPVRLKEGVFLHNRVMFKDGSLERITEKFKNPAVNLALHTIKAGGQALLFCSTRKNAVSLAKKVASAVEASLAKSTKRSLKQLAIQISSAGEKTRISEMLARLVKCGVAFHHAGLGSSHRRVLEKEFKNRKIKILTATPTLAFGVNLPARTVVIHDYRRYEPELGYYPIRVLEYKQMAGRAGRPKYDKIGEALLIARNEDEQDYLMESYVLGDPERIWSKMAVERVLRSHVLATVATGFAHTEQGVYNFFGKTFYAFQYDVRAIKGVIERILRFLYKEKMIDASDGNVVATRFGRRVSELYIDPVSGVLIRHGFRNRSRKLTDFSFLHMIAHTPDMFPMFRAYSREINQLSLLVDEHLDEFMFEVPEEWGDRISFEEFLGETKTAWVLKEWIEETSEDEMIERFRVQPGDLYQLTRTAEWLLHSSHELATLLGCKDLSPQLAELTERVERGVRKELLPLVRLKGVGRVRARILFNSGFQTVENLKRAPLESLTNLPLIGSKLTKKIKEQVGGFVEKEKWEKLKEKTWKQQALTEY